MKQKKIVTIRNIYDSLKQHFEDFPNDGNQQVKIRVSEKGFPAMPTVLVQEFQWGFDWDNGFILTPYEPLVKKSVHDNLKENRKIEEALVNTIMDATDEEIEEDMKSNPVETTKLIKAGRRAVKRALKRALKN